MIPPSRWRTEGGDWPNREASRFVAAGGVRWHVQVAGEGSVVLLLHGTGAASHSWRDIFPDLSRDYTLVAPDLPGHGFSSGIGAPTLPAMARAVAALLVELDLSPALIVGHSAGAAIGLRLAIDAYPVPVVSFNGALLPFPGIAAKLFPAMAKLLFVNPLVPAIFALQARGPGVVAGFLERATGSKIDARGVDLYARLFRRREHVAGALAMMANWDLAALAADFGRVRAPVQLVYGDRDAAIPPSVATEVAKRITGSTTLAMPGLGHLAHEEDPAAAIRIIRDAMAGRD
ncbi:alpha/beta fold hydrolase BchO [Polymorphobacter sp. PAMC 29334]|uniref:alpha/beta fold hydrolase BchO n=1 Tax=Polymorphobacter sp. PAMC 29334 TaxID=2862331 RepID=UPI001D01DC47|nr:alpha/beta fold hydrolase BchO [Polymorphobacter sp. PAMC 29334]